MTEDEAKTKWCPHAIASHTDPRQHNGEVWLHNCIGSACMAWRWSYPPDEAAGNKNGPQGYCGLAGRP